MRNNVFLLILLFVAISCGEQSPSVALESTTGGRNQITKSVSQKEYSFPEIDWGQFETHFQKVEACTIPDSILCRLSTRGLVDACVNYPLLFDAFAYSSPVIGLKALYRQFNGLRELNGRTDKVSATFEFIESVDLREVDFYSLDEVQVGYIMLRYIMCEYLLSSCLEVGDVAKDDAINIAKFSKAVLEFKEMNPHWFSGFDISASLYLLVASVKCTHCSLSGQSEDFLKSGLLHKPEDYIAIKDEVLVILATS